MFFHFYSKPLVGVDIHPDEIRLMQLSRGRCILQAHVIKLKSGTLKEGKMVNPDHVKKKLAQIVSMNDMKGCPAALSLPSSSVITKRITLSEDLSANDRETVIQTNLKNYFPGLGVDLCFDFDLLGKTHTGYDEAIIFAARQEQLNEYISVVNEAGLRVEIVDVELFALSRALNLKQVSGQMIAILEINLSQLQFNLLKKETNTVESVFSQTLTHSPSEINIQDLIKKFKQTIQFCFSTQRQTEFKELILIGNLPILSVIAEAIQKECGLSVNLIDPFLNLHRSDKINMSSIQESPSRMLVSLGLALRGI